MGSLYNKVKASNLGGGVAGGGSLYERAQRQATIGAQQPVVSAPVEAPEADRPGFISRSLDSIKGLVKGEVKPMDVVKEIPGAAKDVGVGFADTFIPAVTNFVKTTGSIFGEGLAYAIDPNVREQYEAGNTDILPTITNTTQAKLAKATIAAGIETAILRAIPPTMKMGWKTRAGIGTLSGVGFAVTEGLAHDKTPEEIVDSLPAYGIMGGAIEVIAPFLLPLLRAETSKLPAQFKNIFRKVEKEAAESTGKLTALGEAEINRVPLNEPNPTLEAHLRKQGYEPYIPDSQLVDSAGKDDLRTVMTGLNEAGYDLKQVSEIMEKVIQKNNTGRFTPKEISDVARQFKPAAPKVAPSKIIKGGRETPYDPRRPIPEQPVKVSERAVGEPIAMKGVDEAPPAYSVDEFTPETRTTKVPSENLPIVSKEGTERVSRLEARLKQRLDDVNPGRAEAEGISTYNQMNKKETLARSAKLADESPDEVMAMLRGEKPIPEGNLFNSLAMAMEEKALTEADANLALKLASLRSTRAGQEISILTEADPTNAVSQIQEIIKARINKASRTLKGSSDVGKAVKSEISAGKEVVKQSRLKIEEAESLLDSILC